MTKIDQKQLLLNIIPAKNLQKIMAKLKLYLDTRRATKTGEYPLKLAINHKGSSEYLSLDIYLKQEQWKNGFVVDHKKIKQLNNLIQSTLSQAEDDIKDMRKTHNLNNLSAKDIKNYLKNIKREADPETEEDRYLLDTHFQKYIEQCKKKNTKDSYQWTFSTIKNYSKDTLSFEDINYNWLKEFEQKLTEQGLSTNSRAIHFRNLRAVFNDALNRELTEAKYPFKKFRIDTEKTEHRSITVEQLLQVFNYSGTESENWARDVAMLMFYLIGINGADLYGLNNIKNGYINYQRNKTYRLYSIKIEPEAAELLNRFKGESHLLCFQEQFSESDALLKKVNGKETTDKKTGKRKITKRGLNTIGETLGIPGLTSYVMRHTWATIAAYLDIPKETIAAALGHGGNTVTDIYIDFDQKKIDAANRKVINYVNNYKTEKADQ